jgi:hypothetical protein
MYFDYGYPALEALCYGFASWYVDRVRGCQANERGKGKLNLRLIMTSRPDPVPGAELQLPLLTDLLTVRLPDLTEEPQLPPPMTGGKPMVGLA